MSTEPAPSTPLRTHATAALALVGLAAPPILSEWTFAPEEGTELSARYDQGWVLELEEQAMTVVIDGEETEQESPDVEITIETHDDYTFELEILEVEDGRVTRFQRTLDEVTAISKESAEAGGGESFGETREGETELEGVPVVFVWDEDGGEYSAELGEDAEDVDEELLEGVVGDDVLASFLPGGGDGEEAEEGDSWDVDLAAFRYLSNPGGDLKIVKEGDADDQDEFEEAFYENLDGEITAEHLGVRDVDGRELVVIGIAIEVATEVDRSQDVDNENVEGTIEESFAFEFDVEGELLWDPEAGHGRSLELEGSIGLDLAREQEIQGGGADLQIQVDQQFEGTFEYTVTIE